MPKADQGIAAVPEDGRPRAAALAHARVTTANEFAQLMSSLIGDVLEGNISPVVCNAACNAGGKLLKVVEMQHRYGKPLREGQEKELILCGQEGESVRQRIEHLQHELDALKVQA
jgi:hypothetical protein